MTDQTPTSTILPNLQLSLRGFSSEEQAKELGHYIGAMIREIGRYIDVGTLEAVIVAFDYEAALAEVDRGVETTDKLAPSKDWALGIAMTPAVLREGSIKSLILINAHVASWLLEDPEGQDYGEAFHAVAHECAHVELSAVFDRQFPGRLLQQKYDGWYEALRGEVFSTCWDEYAATRISAGFGADPTAGYEKVFLGVLEKAGTNVLESILKYRCDGDLDALVIAAQDNLGNLMKYASYMLGNNDGFDRDLADLPPATRDALEGHWFRPFLGELHEVLREIWMSYGQWETLAPFEKIGDIWLRLMRDRGLDITPTEGGGMYVDVPFTVQTSPLQATFWEMRQSLRGLSSGLPPVASVKRN